MQSSSIIFLIFGFLTILTVTEGCFMMGGGGGGCGCAPPPPMCGCGGRKKRSTSEPSEPSFHGIAASDEEILCNHPELKNIIRENMHNSTSDSSKAINGVLESKQLQRFVVVCSENPSVFTVRADTAYCGATKNGHNCHAFAL